eukprot:5589622-Pyramimonas_sp.AAC.1
MEGLLTTMPRAVVGNNNKHGCGCGHVPDTFRTRSGHARSNRKVVSTNRGGCGNSLSTRGIFSQRTNRVQEAWVYSHDGPITDGGLWAPRSPPSNNRNTTETL